MSAEAPILTRCEPPRGGVLEVQRARILAALVEVTREHGLHRLTVAQVVTRSGVSRRTFYELFADLEDCLLGAFEEVVEQAAQRVIRDYRAQRTWRSGLRAGLFALLEFIEDEPQLGAFCIVDALGAGPRTLAYRARVIGALADAVDEGRGAAKVRLEPTRLTAEGAVGAVLAVLHDCLSRDEQLAKRDEKPVGGRDGHSDGERHEVTTLLGPLMGIVLLPYLGGAAAAREAAQPGPARRRVPSAPRDPLHDLEMRLTYRTMRVLLAVADAPGASNRAVARAAGIQDQGQISKLLARLQHLGLLRNAGRRSRGEPNAWRLTARGGEIAQVLRQRAPTSAPRG